MEQTCCQENVESIMRRLKGQGTPYTPPLVSRVPPSVPSQSREIEELKDAIRALGIKLKQAYQEVADARAALRSGTDTNQQLADALQTLQASFNAKDQELLRAIAAEREATTAVQRAQKNTTSLNIHPVHEELAALTAEKRAWEHERDELLLQQQSWLREKETHLRKEQSWTTERSTLEASLEQERQKRRVDGSSNNGQLVRLSMTCKQLEGEVHSLQCERAAINRQFHQQKEQLEEAQKKLSTERERIQGFEAQSATNTLTVQDLVKTIEAHTHTIHTLTIEKEALATRETSYLSTISDLNLAIAREKTNNETLAGSLKAVEELKIVLSQQLEQERRSSKEAHELASMNRREKEASDIRIKEVEELLITKLQAITDLEEHLEEAITTGEDFEHRAATAEQTIVSLTEDLLKITTGKEELHERALNLEQALARSTTENSELKKRTEAFERLKKSVTEASSHAHAIIRTLGHGPRPASITEDLPQAAEPTLFEEHYEQHELF